MSGPKALLDSNVLIASVVEAHKRHQASSAMIAGHAPRAFAVAAHSFAETYSTLTRQSPTAPFRWSAEDAWAAVESLAAHTVLVGLSPGQTFEAIRTYAAQRGVGARLYDRLIGQAAVEHQLTQIVTWNVAHFRSLFPGLDIVTPSSA